MRRHHFKHSGRRELALDQYHKKVGGVCAGIANYYSIPRLYTRIAAVVALCIIPEATLIGYGLAYFILEERDER